MSKAFKRTVIAVLIIGTVLILYLVRGILWPFLLSALLAYFITPLIDFFEQFGIKKMIAVIFLYLAVFGAIAGALIIVAPAVVHQAVSLNKNLPEYTAQVKGITLVWQWKIENRFPMVKEKDLFNKATTALQNYLSDFLNNIPSYIMNVFSIFALLFIVPFATFFFIVDGKAAMNALYRNLPPRYIETVLSVISELDEALGRYIRYQMIEAGFVGLLSFIGLVILGVNYSLLIAILAGMANMIPYFGPTVGMTVGIAVGFIQFKALTIVIQIFVLFIIVQFIDNNFIQPIIISKGTNLHPMVIFFSVIAGAEILGVLGMFLAVPVAVMIKVVFSILLKKSAGVTVIEKEGAVYEPS
jgi:predicted PurR-regulated permease PerM